MNFRREDVASRYALQRVCSTTVDADDLFAAAATAEELEAEGVAGVDFDAALLAEAGACFGVLSVLGVLGVFGAILFYFFALVRSQ